MNLLKASQYKITFVVKPTNYFKYFYLNASQLI